MTNDAERDYWAGPMGRVWVDRQADLDLLMARSTDLLMEGAALRPGTRVLDVGCGSGASTLAAARAVGPSGHVTGLDFSPQLLALARAGAEAAGLAQVSLVEGDAQVDRAPGAPFDAVVSRFGMMFFAEPVAAFRNLAAQLRPGAFLTFVAWGPAAENPWFAVPHRLAADRLGPAPPAEPGAPGPTAFADPARVAGLLGEAGLHEARGEFRDIALHHPGGAAALADLAVSVGPAARLLRLKEGTAADREALRHAIEDALAAFATADGVSMPARLVLYSARTP